MLLLVLTGCGQTPPQLSQVQGRVFYRGNPLPGGTIVFTPDPEMGGQGPLAVAEIQPDGHYTLRTGQQTGAVPGWHRITVASVGATSLPGRYRHPELSIPPQEVRAAVVNNIDIHLE